MHQKGNEGHQNLFYRDLLEEALKNIQAGFKGLSDAHSISDFIYRVWDIFRKSGSYR